MSFNRIRRFIGPVVQSYVGGQSRLSPVCVDERRTVNRHAGWIRVQRYFGAFPGAAFDFEVLCVDVGSDSPASASIPGQSRSPSQNPRSTKGKFAPRQTMRPRPRVDGDRLRLFALQVGMVTDGSLRGDVSGRHLDRGVVEFDCLARCRSRGLRHSPARSLADGLERLLAVAWTKRSERARR